MAKKNATKSGKNQPRTACEEVPVKPARKKSPKAKKDEPKAKPEVEAKVAPDAKPVRVRHSFTPGARWQDLTYPEPLAVDKLVDGDEMLLYYGLCPRCIENLLAERQAKNAPDDPQCFPLPVKKHEKRGNLWSLSAIRTWYWHRALQTVVNAYYRSLIQRGNADKHVELLCEVVADTMFQVYLESQEANKPFTGVTPVEIGKRMGLYIDDAPWPPDGTVMALLEKLYEDGRVVYTGDGEFYDEWILTTKELDARIKRA